MSVALYPTQPADVVGNASTTLTTASFAVPAQTYVVAMVACDNASTTAPNGTVTDNRGGSWTLLKRSATSSQGTAEVWGSYRNDPESSVTVSVSFTNGFSSAADATLCVRILTGASRTQPGGSNTASGTVNTVSVTPTQIGSRIFGMLSCTQGAISYVANAQTTALKLNADTTSTSTQWAFAGIAPITSISAVTYGSTTTAATSTDIAAVEILPSNGLANNYQSIKVGNGMGTGERLR